MASPLLLCGRAQRDILAWQLSSPTMSLTHDPHPTHPLPPMHPLRSEVTNLGESNSGLHLSKAECVCVWLEVGLRCVPVTVYTPLCLMITSVMLVGNQELRLLWAGSGTSDQKKVFLLQKETSEVWISLPSGS